MSKVIVQCIFQQKPNSLQLICSYIARDRKFIFKQFVFVVDVSLFSTKICHHLWWASIFNLYHFSHSICVLMSYYMLGTIKCSLGVKHNMCYSNRNSYQYNHRQDKTIWTFKMKKRKRNYKNIKTLSNVEPEQ